MTEAHRQRTIRTKLARLADRPSPPLSTGFQDLDSALGIGGLPRGAITELFGPPSSGKTTLALQIAAQAQSQACTAAWIDAERVFDPRHAGELGVVVERMPIAVPESAEQALEIARRLVASAALDLLVIDSAAALVPELELESGLGSETHGLQARVLASCLRRFSRTVALNGTAVVFLNQIRSRARSERESGCLELRNPETTAGGPSLKMYASVRIALDVPLSGRIGFRILKNKAAEAFRAGAIPFHPDTGFSRTQ
jgi:recombination protein RecA